MAKAKKSTPVNKTAVAKEMRKDPRIEQIYEEEVTFMCPVRGLVKQKVKIKKYKTLSEQVSDKHIVAPGSLIDSLEKDDDGLSIYKEGDLEVETE